MGTVYRAESTASEVRRELDETVSSPRHPGGDQEFSDLLEKRSWCQARLALRRGV
ncbi:MAG: hypothetical protein ACYTEZ_13095 [Planctomycetota bacterium]|jgi:hypothetical protein